MGTTNVGVSKGKSVVENIGVGYRVGIKMDSPTMYMVVEDVVADVVTTSSVYIDAMIVMLPESGI